MKRDLWLNLSSKDVLKAVDFYEALGFKIVDHFPRNPSVGGFYIGSTPIMIFEQKQFASITNSEVRQKNHPVGVLISYQVSNQKEAREIVEKALSLGAESYNEPMVVDGMFHIGFIDLDGHRLDVVAPISKK